MAKKNNPNIFGDTIEPISGTTIAIRTRILIDRLTTILVKQKDLSGYFETLLDQMASETKTVLFINLAKWLKNRPKDFHDELDLLLTRCKLTDVFEKALSNWEQELMLNITSRKGRIREAYATQLFPLLGTISIPIAVIHQESHHANHADMIYVCAMASISNATKIFEFGTYRGQTTCGLASVCKDAQIYTLNLPLEDDPRYAPYIGMYIANSPDRDRITQIFCDSRTFDTSPYSESMDYIFIDGDHSYEGVKNDTEKALQLLKPGGIIVWHDYAAKSPGVLKYLAEFSLDRPLFQLRKTCLAVYVDGLDSELHQLTPMDASLEVQECGED